MDGRCDEYVGCFLECVSECASLTSVTPGIFNIQASPSGGGSSFSACLRRVSVSVMLAVVVDNNYQSSVLAWSLHWARLNNKSAISPT